MFAKTDKLGKCHLLLKNVGAFMQEYWKVKLLIEFCRLKRVFFALGNIRFQPNSDVGFLWMGGVTCVGDGKSMRDK